MTDPGLPRRVLLVAHDAHLGGAQLALADTARTLSDADVEVHVQVPWQAGDCPLVEVLRTAGAQVHRVRTGLWLRPPGSERAGALRTIRSIAMAAVRTRGLIRELGVDLVISNTGLPASAALAARATGVPHIWWLHERQLREDRLQPELPLPLIRQVMRRTGRVVVPSDFLAQEVCSWLSPALVDVVPPALFLGEPLSEAELRQRIEALPTRLLFPGGLLTVKRPSVAVLAASRLARDVPDLTLDIVGHDGPERAAVEGLVDTAGLLRLRGFLPSLAPELVPGTVLLSCGAEETFGRVLAEAMAAGVPVVAADAGASRDVVQHGKTGLLYDPDEPDDLAACLRRLLTDEPLRERLIRAAHAESRTRWTPAAHREQLRGVWARVAPADRR